VLLLDEVERKLRDLFIGYWSTVFEQLALHGPVVVRFELYRALRLKATRNTKGFMMREHIRAQIRDSSVAVTENGISHAAPEECGQPYTDGENMIFDEESSVEEMLDQPENILGRLMTRISTAFGLWGDEVE
jgi:hypothetical protein